MAVGTEVNRQWVLTLHSGVVVIDWGDEIYQEVHNGAFIHVDEREVSHHTSDEELETLRKAGRVNRYTATVVFFINLAERPMQTIE